MVTHLYVPIAVKTWGRLMDNVTGKVGRGADQVVCVSGQNIPISDWKHQEVRKRIKW